mgnify:CR=1 FL=1
MQDPPLDGWNVPLIRDNEIVERPADQTTITRRYTAEAVKFIAANKEQPFLVLFNCRSLMLAGSSQNQTIQPCWTTLY